MIAAMAKVTLISLRCFENDIVKALQQTENVEIIAPNIDSDTQLLNESLFSEIENEIKRLEKAGESLKPFAKQPGLFTPLPQATIKQLNDAKQRSYAVCEKVEAINAEISKLNSEINTLNHKRDSLLDWKNLETPVQNIKNTKHTRIICGFVPVQDAQKLKELPIAVTYVKSDNTKLAPCVIAYHKQSADEVAEGLRQLAFVEYTFDKSLYGTAFENAERLSREIVLLEAQKKEKETELSACSGDMETLLFATDAARAEIERLKAMNDILKSKSSFILQGWIKESDAAFVEQTIKDITDAYYIEFSQPQEDDDVPTVVQNNKIVTPFESIVDMYSKPSYKGVDATPLMVPFYALFFGMMLADIGYGLLLSLGLFLYEKIKKPTGGMKGLVGTIKWSGVATVICGILFGSFFGVDVDTILGTKDVFPLIMDPMKNVMYMLYLSCGMGILHMIFGLCIKIKMCIARGDVASAIYDNLSWIFLIVGILGAALLKKPFNMPFIVFAALGTLLIIVFGGREKKGIMKVFGGFSSLYNITGWLSDTVSYARIFAIGVAGGAMGEVFNMIGSMIASSGSGIAHVLFILFAIVVLVALHAFSIFINTLSAFAHTARLQYVEFFGKFYEPGGRAFSPLAINAKNVRFEKDAKKRKQ